MKLLVILNLMISFAFAANYSCRGNGVTVDITELSDGTAEIVVVKNGKTSIAKNAEKEVTFDIEYEGNASGDAKAIKVIIVDGGTDTVELLKDFGDDVSEIECSEK